MRSVRMLFANDQRIGLQIAKGGSPPSDGRKRIAHYALAFMALDVNESTLEFIRSHRVARLATTSVERQPVVIPICYVFDGESIYTPIDEKPKSVDAASLRRVRNIRACPNVAIVVDDYSEDWTRLSYVLISGPAEIIPAGDDASEHARAVELLREKYPQYRSMKLEQRPIIRITPSRIKRWAAA